MGACTSTPKVPEGANYTGGWKDGKKHSETPAKYTWADGSTYEGPFVEDHMEGEGVFRDGRGEYTGQFHESKMHGHGRFVYRNGDVYTGQFRNGKRHGQGRFVSQEPHETYEGSYVEDMKQGEGAITYENDHLGRLRYNGGFLMDKKNGIGSLFFIKDAYYTGEFREDVFHGAGKLVTAEGDTFEGTFQFNFLTQGQVKLSNGNVYQGQLQRHVFEGRGEMTYSNGDRYVGEWKNGKQHGSGEWTGADGSQYIGDWAQGERSGQGRLRLPDGDVFIGTFQHNRRANGPGVLECADGSRYEGEFLNEQRHGRGKQLFVNGNTYDGEWEHNQQHGQGTMTFVMSSDGVALNPPEIFKGSWVRGKPQSAADNLRLAALKLAAVRVETEASQAAEELDGWKKNNIDPKNACMRCQGQLVNTLFLECAHCVCCEECANLCLRENKCFKCHAPIARVVRTFSS